MEYPNIGIFRTEPQERGRFSNEKFCHISVALIDTTEYPSIALYEIKPNLWDEKLLDSGLHLLIENHPDAFLYMGQISSVDKQQKRIYLSKDNIVQYDHLIIACGPQHIHSKSPHHFEFVPGLHSLIDALRIQKSVKKNKHQKEDKTVKKLKTLIKASKQTKSDIKNVGQKILQKELKNPYVLSLNGLDRMVYLLWL